MEGAGRGARGPVEEQEGEREGYILQSEEQSLYSVEYNDRLLKTVYATYLTSSEKHHITTPVPSSHTHYPINRTSTPLHAYSAPYDLDLGHYLRALDLPSKPSYHPPLHLPSHPPKHRHTSWHTDTKPLMQSPFSHLNPTSYTPAIQVCTQRARCVGHLAEAGGSALSSLAINERMHACVYCSVRLN